MWKNSFFIVGLFSSTLFAREIPGGVLTSRLATVVPSAYLSLAPGMGGGGQGAYLTARLHLEHRPGVRIGLVGGSGSSGFHFGAEGEWEVFAAGAWRGALGLSSVFARDGGQGFFTLGGSGTLGRAFVSSLGVWVPFAGAQVTPSLALGQGASETGLRTLVGLNWEVSEWGRANLWVQWAVGLARARSEGLLGVSIPFATL